MSKFTQGKWSVRQGAGIDEIDVVDTEDRSICVLFYYPVTKREEEEANARLIAAAPEMYELLKEVVQWKDDCVWDAMFKAQKLLARIDDDEADLIKFR